MQTYISILRGINVSGHKMIKMDALRAMYESLKFTEVKTYIQSGNVVFKTKATKSAELEKKIATAIEKTFGFEVPVLVLEAEELKTVLNNNPFLKKRKEDPIKLHVTFLAGVPAAENIEKLKGGNYAAADEYVIIGKSVYLFCPNGYGNTKLSNTFLENKLKLSATTRNWKTINELLNLAENN